MQHAFRALGATVSGAADLGEDGADGNYGPRPLWSHSSHAGSGWTRRGLAIGRSGVAWLACIFDRPRFEGEVPPYANAQRDAQMTGFGMWAGHAQMAPWVWRKGGLQSPRRKRCVLLAAPGAAP